MALRETASVKNETGDKLTSFKAWFSIAVIVLLVMFSMIDRNAVNLMIDPIRKSFDINDFQISLLQGPAFAIFFLLGSLLMGWMVDKYSNRWLIYVGVIVWSIATIASGLAGSFAILLAARCFVGLGESVLQPAGWNVVSKLFPPHRQATAIGTLTAGSQVGVAASFLLTGFLISEANQVSMVSLPFIGTLQPWQWVFIAAGVPGLLLATLVFVIPSEKKADKTPYKNNASGLIVFVRENKRFLAHHFLGFGLLSVMVNWAAAWGPTYLTRIHGIEIKDIGLLLGLVGVPLGVGGVIVAGWLVDRSFKRGTLDAHFSHFAVRAFLVALLGGIGFSFDTNVIFPLICFGFIQFIQPFSGVAGASLQISVPQTYRGRISAVFIMFYNAAGMMLGPSFVALLSNLFGSDRLGMALAINYIVLGAGAAILIWKGRKYAEAAYQRYNF